MDNEKVNLKTYEKAIKMTEEDLEKTQLRIKEIRPSNKQKIVGTAIKSLSISFVMTLFCKVAGLGYPFYQENIHNNLVITSEINKEGEKEEINREYDFLDWEGIPGYILKTDTVEIFNYSDYTNTGIEENVRYIEKYNVTTVEEALEVLSTNKYLESALGKPEIIKDRILFSKNEKSGVKIIEKAIQEEYILEKEGMRRNVASSLFWSFGGIYSWWIISKLLKKSKLTVLEEKESEYTRKLQKLKQDYENEKRK